MAEIVYSKAGIARSILHDIDKATVKMLWDDLVPSDKRDRDLFTAVLDDVKSVENNSHFGRFKHFENDEQLKGYVEVIVDNFMHVLMKAEEEYGADVVDMYISSHIYDLIQDYRSFGFDYVWDNYREFSAGEQLYQDLRGFASEFNARAENDFPNQVSVIADLTMKISMLRGRLDANPNLPAQIEFIDMFVDRTKLLERGSGEDMAIFGEYLKAVYIGRRNHL